MACGAVTPATPTLPPPTDTATALPPTNTPKPTSTPRPTSTPNLAATQQYEGWQAEVQRFADQGLLEDTAGKFKTFDDFNEEWAQMNWYQFWPVEEVNSNFMFGAHFKWSTASDTPELSGCGIAFGIQPNEDHYSVFLDRGRILFMMARGTYNYAVGKTSGPGTTSFGNPAEADFQVLVKDGKAHVAVDGEITNYTLSADQSTAGELALSVLSGTNRDYGTRCEMTDIHVWTPQ
jgi:hypothetical protein